MRNIIFHFQKMSHIAKSFFFTSLSLSLSLSIYIYIYYWKNIFILYKLCATENRTKIYFYVLLEYVHFWIFKLGFRESHLGCIYFKKIILGSHWSSFEFVIRWKVMNSIFYYIIYRKWGLLYFISKKWVT